MLAMMVPERLSAAMPVAWLPMLVSSPVAPNSFGSGEEGVPAPGCPAYHWDACGGSARYPGAGSACQPVNRCGSVAMDHALLAPSKTSGASRC